MQKEGIDIDTREVDLVAQASAPDETAGFVENWRRGESSYSRISPLNRIRARIAYASKRKEKGDIRFYQEQPPLPQVQAHIDHYLPIVLLLDEEIFSRNGIKIEESISILKDLYENNNSLFIKVCEDFCHSLFHLAYFGTQIDFQGNFEVSFGILNHILQGKFSLN